MASSTSCKLEFFVAGNKASADETSCTVGYGGSGCPVVGGTMTQYPFTLTLQADDTELDVSMDWSGLVGPYGCNARQCTGHISGTLTKVI